ncbi:MAG TPA: hypothetical protein DDZ39_02285 [Flavobacteriaceae bacterium]|nr:hypothetical protein [Flavobacteriaceae bacterium]HBS12580.1 hypothetical protein [Flavobacteriaceae bacterium]
MKNKFWIEKKDLNQLYKELTTRNPQASFWDIFNDYEPRYEELADISNEWLEKQDKLIDKIINAHFVGVSLSQNDIDDIIEASEEFLFYEDEMNFEGIRPEWIEIAGKIGLQIKGLNDLTTYSFLDKLAERLENNSNREDYEEKSTILDDFDYPTLELAYSNTFYDENDCGYMDYKEIEQKVSKKFTQYKKKISELLNQEPSRELQPLQPKEYSDEFWNLSIDFTEKNSFSHIFNVNLAVWKKKNNVLFLYTYHEDKELPYLINIGGLTLEKYKETLSQYNHLIQNLDVN